MDFIKRFFLLVKTRLIQAGLTEKVRESMRLSGLKLQIKFFKLGFAVDIHWAKKIQVKI